MHLADGLGLSQDQPIVQVHVNSQALQVKGTAELLGYLGKNPRGLRQAKREGMEMQNMPTPTNRSHLRSLE